MQGYIWLHREIQKHWIFEKAEYFRAWAIIILNVNHAETKVNIDGEIMICKRGESLRSLSTWVNLFGKNWSIQKVRTFFKLLKSDNMIEISGKKTTQLTIVNYDKYNTKQHDLNTTPTQEQHDLNTKLTTNNNDNTDNTEKEEEEPTVQPFNYEKIKDLYNSICVDLPKCLKMSTKRKDKIKTRLKDLPELKDWDNLFKITQDTPFCKGNNDRNWKADLDWLIKNDDNYIKVLERKYDSSGNQSEQKQQEIKWNPVD